MKSFMEFYRGYKILDCSNTEYWLTAIFTVSNKVHVQLISNGYKYSFE